MNYTYMLECSDGSLYTGWTNDIEKRVRNHNAGKGAKYTKSRLPVKLVYTETFDSKEEAMSREYHIKRLTRREKMRLIAAASEKKGEIEYMAFDDVEKMMAKIKDRTELIKDVRVRASEICEDILCYNEEEVVELVKLENRIMYEDPTQEEAAADALKYREIVNTIQKRADAPERIYLWKEGNMPSETEYTDNSEFRNIHNPDFKPYMYEMLIPEDSNPRGAVVVCAGGDHGSAVVSESYGVAKQLNKMGYQCILLLNRPNHMPWNGHECGADSARALRYVRKNAERFRVKENNVAFAGFSNGGLTGEACIQFYSGEKKVTDYFKDYVPDELDSFYGGPDAFLCVYGPRFNGDESFVWEGTVYPPVFYAIGRLDNAIDNFNFVYPDLLKHNVPVEVHTFAGVPHGKAGADIKGQGSEIFNLWEPLADNFLQDVFKNLR